MTLPRSARPGSTSEKLGVKHGRAKEKEDQAERSAIERTCFNSDWIEKTLAHEDGRSSRGVYNKAEYEVQRRHMMQEWSDIVDAWVGGKKYVPTLSPPSMPILEPDPAL